MARRQTDRPDLLGELTALARRVELMIGDRSVICGFRANSALSMYFGQDFVVGCNGDHQVRRIYLHGVIYRAENRNDVVKLVPERNDAETILHSTLLSPMERQELRSIIRWHVEMLCRALAGDRYRIVGCFPEDQAESILADVRAELHKVLDNGPAFADGAPRSRGKGGGELR
jgi:hypothetical protein